MDVNFLQLSGKQFEELVQSNEVGDIRNRIQQQINDIDEKFEQGKYDGVFAHQMASRDRRLLSAMLQSLK